MPIGMQMEDDGRFLVVALAGTVVREDYKPLIEEFTRLATGNGKIRVLLDMTRFHGWGASALWQEIKFDLKYREKLDRLAIVGDARWQHAIATFARPLTPAEVRYFDGAQIHEARAWLTGSTLLRDASAA
jgi:SpoIIAA-like